MAAALRKTMLKQEIKGKWGRGEDWREQGKKELNWTELFFIYTGIPSNYKIWFTREPWLKRNISE